MSSLFCELTSLRFYWPRVCQRIIWLSCGICNWPRNNMKGLNFSKPMQNYSLSKLQHLIP